MAGEARSLDMPPSSMCQVTPRELTALATVVRPYSLRFSHVLIEQSYIEQLQRHFDLSPARGLLLGASGLLAGTLSSARFRGSPSAHFTFKGHVYFT